MMFELVNIKMLQIVEGIWNMGSPLRGLSV